MAGLGWLGITLPRGVRRHRRQLPRPVSDLRGDGPLPRAEPAPRHGRGRGRLDPRRRHRRAARARASRDRRRRLHREPRGRRARRHVRPGRHRVHGASRSGGDFVLTRHEAARRRTRRRPTGSSCAARTERRPGRDGISLFLVDAARRGISCDPDAEHRRQRAVRGDASTTSSAPAENLVGALDGGWAPLSAATTKAAVLQTATIVGAASAGARDDEPVRQGPRAVR